MLLDCCWIVVGLMLDCCWIVVGLLVGCFLCCSNACLFVETSFIPSSFAPSLFIPSFPHSMLSGIALSTAMEQNAERCQNERSKAQSAGNEKEATHITFANEM